MAKSNERVRSSFLLFIGDPIPTENIKYPCVVKASKGEDSKSVRLVKDKQSLDAAIKHALTYSNQVIIERYRLSRLYSSKMQNVEEDFAEVIQWLSLLLPKFRFLILKFFVRAKNIAFSIRENARYDKYLRKKN